MTKKIVYLALDFMKPDATQYKPVDIQVRSPKDKDVLIEFELNEEHVVSSGDLTILTPDGLKEIAAQMMAASKEAYWQFEDWASDTLKKKR